MMCIRVRWHLSNLENSSTLGNSSPVDAAETQPAPSARVNLHLEGCEACATFYEQLLRLQNNLRSSKDKAPLPSFTKPKPKRIPFALPTGCAIAVAGFLLFPSGPSTIPASSLVSMPSPQAPAGATRVIADATHNEPTRARHLKVGLAEAHTKVISGVRKLGQIDDPLMRELAAWRSDSLRGLTSIRRLGRD